MRKALACICFLLTACAATPPPGPTVVYRDVLKEVPRACPVKRPAKPAPLARPLPDDPGGSCQSFGAGGSQER